MSWANLRAAFPALSPAQLHRLLTQYQLASAMGPMSAWEPVAPDLPDAFKSGKHRPWAGLRGAAGRAGGRGAPGPAFPGGACTASGTSSSSVPCPVHPWGPPQLGVKEPTVHGQVPSFGRKSDPPWPSWSLRIGSWLVHSPPGREQGLHAGHHCAACRAHPCHVCTRTCTHIIHTGMYARMYIPFIGQTPMSSLAVCITNTIRNKRMVSVSSRRDSRAFNTIRPRPCHLGPRPGQGPALSRTPGCQWTAFAPPTYLFTAEVSEGGLCVGSGASLPAARCSSCSRPTCKRAARVPGTMGGISSGLQAWADQAQLPVWAGSGRRQALGVGTAPAFFILGGHRDLKGTRGQFGLVNLARLHLLHCPWQVSLLVPGSPSGGRGGQPPLGQEVRQSLPRPQRTSWSPTRTPHPSFCRVRASYPFKV